MATRYWGPGGNGLWSSSTNWSAAATGAPTGASVPGAGDLVIFNANAGSGVATVDSNVTVQTLNLSSFTGTLAFGTNTISLSSTTASTVVFTGGTGYSVSGTPVINITNPTANTLTITGASSAEANTISFNITAGTYTLAIGSGSSFRDMNFTGFSGVLSAGGLTVYGDFTLSPTMTHTATTSILTFASTSPTPRVITTNAVTMDRPITFNGVGGTWKLADALTMSATRTLTLTNGTFDLNSKAVQTGLFSANNANTKSLAFGTGSITCIGAGGTLWNMSATNTTVTGTPTVNISYAGALATTVNTGNASEANSISFNFTAGTYTLTFLTTSGHTARSVDFTGFSGTLGARSNPNTLYGSLKLSSTMTVAAGAGTIELSGTSGVQTITSNGVTFDQSITVRNDVTLVGNLTLGSTRMFGHSAGTLNLSDNTLTTGFYTGYAGTRAIAFGTGNITCNGAGGTIFTHSATGFSLTGTPTVNISYAGALATTVVPGASSEANALSFNFTTGTYALSLMTSPTFAYAVRDLNFSGFAGTWSSRSGLDNRVYGNLTFSSGMTLGASTAALVLSKTSGLQTITTNGKTIDVPLTFDGVGGSFILADPLTMATARAISLINGAFDGNSKTISGASSFGLSTGSASMKGVNTAIAFSHTSGTLTQSGNNSTGTYTITDGTLDLAGYVLTSPSFVTAIGTKNITFNGGTLAITNATTTAFNNAQPTGFTTTAGAGTGKISMTAATAKTFVGGGSTFNCTLSNDGAGPLTVSGNNTFTTVANGVQPTTFTFTAGSTQTITNWNVSGTAGNLVTITSSTAGTAATLSIASGTVSADYLSLKDSAATGGATWYAGANSTNVSGNSGWVFSAAPSTGTTLSFAITEPQDTSAIGITAQTSAALAATDPPDTVSIAGTVSWPALSAALDATEVQDTAAFSANVVSAVTVTLAATEAQDVAAFTATVSWATISAALDATEVPDTAAFSANVISPIMATLAATEVQDAAAFSANVISPITAALAATEAQDVASLAVTISAAPVLLSLSATDTPDTVSVSVIGDRLAISSNAISSRAVSGGVGRYFCVGSLNATEPQDAAAFTANVISPLTAVLAVTEAKDAASFAANVFTPVVLAATEPPDVAAISLRTPGLGLAIASGPISSRAISGGLASNVRVATLAATEAQDTASISVDLGVAYLLSASGTAYAYNTNAVSLRALRTLALGYSAYSYAGYAANLRHGYKIQVSSAAYVVTGFEARLFATSFLYDDIETLLVPWELKTLSVIPSIYSDETLDMILDIEQRLLEVVVEDRILYVDPRARY